MKASSTSRPTSKASGPIPARPRLASRRHPTPWPAWPPGCAPAPRRTARASRHGPRPTRGRRRRRSPPAGNRPPSRPAPARPRRDAGVGGRLLRRGGRRRRRHRRREPAAATAARWQRGGAGAGGSRGHVGIVLGATAEIEGVRRHADAAGARGAEISTPAHWPVTTGNPESRVPYDVFLNLRHVGRHGGAEPDLAPAARFECSARACSICRPRPRRSCRVQHVGQQRMAQAGHVHADLVRRPVSRRQTTSHTRPPGSTSPRREGK